MTIAPDPLVTDPPHGLEPPATTVPATFDSGGATLLGVLHVPAGPGPHPVVVLLHGFPGNERNFDLAQALRRGGYAALVFHYRGSWGVGGSWSWGHVLEDAAHVVAAMREPATVAAHRLDPERLAVVGHSLGGFAALVTAAADPAVAAVASVAGFDLAKAGAACRADAAVRAAFLEDFQEGLPPLAGTSAAALVAEMEAAPAGWDLAGLAPRLADRPVLLVAGSRDTVTPPPVHHDPLVAAYRAHPLPALKEHVFPTDHLLADHRVALTRTLLGFLDRHFGTAR